jgi:hypothetical protein
MILSSVAQASSFSGSAITLTFFTHRGVHLPAVEIAYELFISTIIFCASSSCPAAAIGILGGSRDGRRADSGTDGLADADPRRRPEDNNESDNRRKKRNAFRHGTPPCA